MILIEVLAIITFIVLLGAALYMLVDFYICDSQRCKPFKQAENIGSRDSKEYTIALLGELYNDGIWPFPYIGAAILTPLSLWFVSAPITVKNFAIVFLVSFITIYFLFAFFGHHYVKFISSYIDDYIKNNCHSQDVNNNFPGEDNIKKVISQDEEISFQNIVNDNNDLSKNNKIADDDNS